MSLFFFTFNYFTAVTLDDKLFVSEVLIEKIAFIGIDMNGYLAERSVLDILYQKVVTGGIIYFDDYGWGAHSQLRETVDDFFKDKPEELLHFPSGNSIIIKK
jgi:hypothetical protein